MPFKNIACMAILSFSANSFAANNILIDGKKVKNSDDLIGIMKKQMTTLTAAGKSAETAYYILQSSARSENIVRIKNLAILRKKMGEQYVDDFISDINEAAEDNPKVVLVLE